MRSLHIADNSSIDTSDKIYNHFNFLLTQMAIPLLELWAIDEAMEPYFSQYSFLEIRYWQTSLISWCLCSRELLLMKYNLYQGKYTGLEDGLGVGESVGNNLVMDFIPAGNNRFIDNFFTMLNLL